MSDYRARLKTKLLRELAQSERDARLHTRREAARLGDTPPAIQLRAIASHADEINPLVSQFIGDKQRLGLRLGRAVASVFSGLRNFLFDRMIDVERSYRATLLGLRHGLDVIKLLREVALIQLDLPLVKICDNLIVERGWLIDEAENALSWFAQQPEIALRSGARQALAPAAT